MDCRTARTSNPLDWLAMCPEFSGPLAHRARERILECAPDLSEAIKWNMLCYSGRKLVCGLSACRAHLGISFFRGAELPDPDGLLAGGGTVMRSVRVTDAGVLEGDALRRLLLAAVEIDEHPRLMPVVRGRREPLPVPEVLARALARNKRAAQGFEMLSPSCRREYIVWIGSAKRPETLRRRLTETLTGLKRGLPWARRREERG